MSAPRWVPLAAVVAIHDRQISRHGGASGLRDMGLVETGWARAVNRHAHGETDLFVLAAAHAFGIAKAHGFVDGNKRTALVVALTFLRLNGWWVRPDPAEGVRQMEALAAGALTEEAFAAWLRKIALPLPGNG